MYNLSQAAPPIPSHHIIHCCLQLEPCITTYHPPVQAIFPAGLVFDDLHIYIVTLSCWSLNSISTNTTVIMLNISLFYVLPSTLEPALKPLLLSRKWLIRHTESALVSSITTLSTYLRKTQSALVSSSATLSSHPTASCGVVSQGLGLGTAHTMQ